MSRESYEGTVGVLFERIYELEAEVRKYERTDMLGLQAENERLMDDLQALQTRYAEECGEVLRLQELYDDAMARLEED